MNFASDRTAASSPRHGDRTRDPLHHFSLRKELIAYSAFDRTVDEMALLHYRWQESSVCEGLLIFGQHGSGKSTAIKHYASGFPRKRMGGVTVIPVLLALTPETPSVVSLSDALLLALGPTHPTTGTAPAKLSRIVHFFKACGVEMLILDEFHHFYDSHRVLEGRRVSDWLKNLMSLTGVCVVLVGLPRSIAVLNANPQLRRRFNSPFHHTEFGFKDAQSQREFRGMLKGIEERLPVRFEKSLEKPAIARQMYYATNGLIDYVVKIIDDAVARCGAASGSVISNENLALAFKRKVWADCPDWINPFLTDKLRRLTQAREPFCDWDDPRQYTLSERTRSSSAESSHHPSSTSKE